jgi:ABC-type transport system involved in multi-copper enzyme maturation permease subunit
MNAVLIAQNTFREAIRDRVLAGMVVAGLVLLVLTQVARPLAMGEGLRLTVDLGLSSITFLGLMVVLLVGTSLVAKEIERRTIFNLLSRPVPRSVYLLGKWAGLSASLWVVASALGLSLWVLVSLLGHPGHALAILEAVYLEGLELTLVTALAVLFSALSTPVLSALYTAGLFLAGQWCDDLRTFAEKAPGTLKTMLLVIADLLPNLPLFNMRTLAAGGELTSFAHLGFASVYALVYCGCVLALAAAALESRDFR